jgi:hypothetical protein
LFLFLDVVCSVFLPKNVHSDPVFSPLQSLQTFHKFLLQLLLLVLQFLLQSKFPLLPTGQLVKFSLNFIINSELLFVLGNFLQHGLIKPWKPSEDIRLDGKLLLVSVGVDLIFVAYSPCDTFVLFVGLFLLVLMALKLSGFELASKVRIVFE